LTVFLTHPIIRYNKKSILKIALSRGVQLNAPTKEKILSFSSKEISIYQTQAEILSNQKLTFEYYKLRLHTPRISREAKPGQFIHIRIEDTYYPLLRRPFSIHRVEGESIDILYQIVGLGTKILSQKRKGDSLNLIGPLGKGFWINQSAKQRILIAGGIGVAPLVFLAQRIREMRTFSTDNAPLAFLGFKTKDKILCQKQLERLGMDVKIATEDGTYGYRGEVSEFFEQFIGNSSSKYISVYACGPALMLKKLSQLSHRYLFFCQVSLEEKMGCGIGACRGCVVKGTSGYLRVCRDGPVFNIDEISWEELSREV